MKKIGVFGGTFNPIHNGHLHIARSFAADLELDSVLLIPSKKPTHKPSPDLAEAEDRLAMCSLAAEGTDFLVSDLEIIREQESYTVYTLEQLKEQYPEDELYLLMGEDMFLTLLQWKAPERLCELAVFCVAPRSHDGRERLEAYGEKLSAIGGRYCITEFPFLPVSSTEIREKLRAGEAVDDLVPESVAQYLKEKQLYKQEGIPQ